MNTYVSRILRLTFLSVDSRNVSLTLDHEVSRAAGASDVVVHRAGVTSRVFHVDIPQLQFHMIVSVTDRCAVLRRQLLAILWPQDQRLWKTWSESIILISHFNLNFY